VIHRLASCRQLSSCKTGLRLSGQRIRLHNPGPLEGEKPREAHDIERDAVEGQALAHGFPLQNPG
ncbi:hypothetical protein QZN00_30410, partial [Burkholderia multivorans]|nr:hypothetical protein [Burkholderia multivorans]